MNSVSMRRQSKRSGCRRNRRYKGGAGMGYRFGASVDPTNPGLGNGAEVIPYASCDYAPRPGYIAPSPTRGGLPGFSGGARYTFEPEVYGPNPIVNHPSIACDAAVQNPLNKGDVASLVTAVPAQMASPTPGGQGYAAAGGSRRRRGKKSRRCWTRRNQMGGVGGVDSMVYEAPRAGYTTVPSNHAGGQSGTLADGKTPFLVNQPYSSEPQVSSSCLKTGGGRRRRTQRKKSKKSRKTRGRK